MLVAFGGKGSELSNQVPAIPSAENYIFSKTDAGSFGARLTVYWVLFIKS